MNKAWHSIGILAMFLMILSLAACGSDTTTSGDGGDDGRDAGPACETDTDCSGGKFCVGGQCVECRTRSDCGVDEVCQAGNCVKDCPIDDRCESGGACCPGDYECVDQVCRPPCEGTRCGHRNELCCLVGQLCEQERCLVDCGADERCGRMLNECCGAGEICYGFACTAPQGNCLSQSDCPPDQVCEVDLGVCLDREVVGDCEYRPPVGVFNPQEEWQWTSSPVESDFNQIMMAPVVANLTDDNLDGEVNQLDIPDVVFINFHSGGNYNGRGVLRVVSGDGSVEHVNITAYNTHPGSCPAIGDLDGDGVPEIVADKQLATGNVITGTYAFHADGSLYWEAPGTGCGTGGPAIADLDGNGFPEVITSDSILTHDGAVLCTFPAGSRLPAAADIDLDGQTQEVINGRGAYRAVADVNGDCEVVWDNGAGGHPAVANFDADPYPEIVFPSAGRLVLVDHQGIEVWSVPIPLDEPRILDIYGIADCSQSTNKACSPGGGAPTIADFDGDGEPEIGLAARWYYLVYESDGSVLWAHKTQDFSSAVTGSSVFDFEADGKAEVVYNDELYMRVYKGAGGDADADGDGFTDPEILVEIPNPSGTLLEYPLVVDVDADGRAEILVAANNYAFPGFTGFRVFGDALDNWVGTRRVWNQHTYHVTNICDGVDPVCEAADNNCGAVPQSERRNWDLEWLNNYRQNVQGEGLFWAPDLVVVNLNLVCELDMSIYVTFDVMNQGSRMAPAGVPVTLYVDGTAIGTVNTTQALRPGQLEHFTFTWPLPEELQQEYFDLTVTADDIGDGTGRFNECTEDNNSSTLEGMYCGVET